MTMEQQQGRPIRVRVEGVGVVEFPAGTSEDVMRQALMKLPEAQQPSADTLAAQRRQPSSSTRRDTLGIVTDSVQKGLVKGIESTAGAVMGGLSKMFPGLNYTPADAAHIDQATTPQNTGERIGYVAEKAIELGVPAVRGGQVAVRAIPSAERAGAAFQEVMGAARNIPIDVSKPGNVALRIMQLSERGGSMPKAVRDFLKRITDPEKGAMTYEEARDFASNISRLSADEFRRLTPVIGKEVHALRVTLNNAVEQAAMKAGKGAEYKRAMWEYRANARLKEAAEKAIKYGVPAGGATLAARYLFQGDK